MSNRVIGKIIAVRNSQIIAEIYSDIGEYINTLDGISFVGEVGSYIIIHDYDHDLVAEIIGINEDVKINDNQQYSKPKSVKLATLSLLGEISDHRFKFGVTRMPRLFMEINVISFDELNTILQVEDSELMIKNGSDTETYIRSLGIGQSAIFDNYEVKVNLDNFFGSHFAVFGNTGAGKSNTIASIIQRIFSKQKRSPIGAHFIVIDTNGEYDKAFSNYSDVNSGVKYRNIKVGDEAVVNKFQIPVWTLSEDDWAILLNASEKTQIPLIRRALQLVKIFNSDDSEFTNKLKNHIIASTITGIITNSDSSPSTSDKVKSIISKYHTNELNADTLINLEEKVEYPKNRWTKQLNLISTVSISFGHLVSPSDLLSFLSSFISTEDLFSNVGNLKSVVYDMSDFIEAMKFAVLYEGSVSSQRIQEYTAPMLSRIQSLSESSMGSIFGKTKFTTTVDFVDDLVTKNQLVNIDVSSIDDPTADVLARALAKMLLDFQKNRKQQNGNDWIDVYRDLLGEPEYNGEMKEFYPINLIIEEAHRYISGNRDSSVIGYDIFERIAKEGRKYNILIGISSQRPSELSKTVVSQCSNFVIHRVQNPDDLMYISRMVPYINKDMIDKLTYLQTGTALVFGTSINIPTLTQFAQAKPRTDSASATISKSWFALTNNEM